MSAYSRQAFSPRTVYNPYAGRYVIVNRSPSLSSHHRLPVHRPPFLPPNFQPNYRRDHDLGSVGGANITYGKLPPLLPTNTSSPNYRRDTSSPNYRRDTDLGFVGGADITFGRPHSSPRPVSVLIEPTADDLEPGAEESVASMASRLLEPGEESIALIACRARFRRSLPAVPPITRSMATRVTRGLSKPKPKAGRKKKEYLLVGKKSLKKKGVRG